MNNTANWSYPTTYRFGVGRVRELGQICRGAGIAHPLLVTDPGLVELPPVAETLAALVAAGVPAAVFSDLSPNPVGRDIDAGVEAYKAGGHDGIIAIGGGSALDVGKVVALMVGQSRPVFDFEDVGDNWTRADGRAIAPVIAVPTTSGTGSEVGRAGVIINEATARKVIIFHPNLMPVVVVADPALTVGLPRVLTVGTGIDALSHSLEAICSPVYHPMSHGIGMEGCRLVFEHLPRVVDDPTDLQSRGQMLVAASMGATAFQKGLGAMHALAHPIGAVFRTHHGMTNAVLMPYVLLANRDAIVTEVERLAAYCGISGGFGGFVEHILELRTTTGVPHTLVEFGVDPDQIEPIAHAAVEDPSAATNPIRIDHQFAASIFDAACRGDLG